MSNLSGPHIVALSGSVRPGNLTNKALALVADEIAKHERATYEWVDPATLDLPLPGQTSTSDSPKRLQDALSRATAVVLATPEYHGSFSSVLKLQIENLGFPSGLTGKPVALLGVAAGAIGAIKSLEHLRGVCSHVGAMVLPMPVSIAFVHKRFNKDGSCNDEQTEKMIRGLATSILNYIHESICPKFTLEAMVREAGD